MKGKRKKKIEGMTLKDLIEDPDYLEMAKITDDIAGHLVNGNKKFTI